VEIRFQEGYRKVHRWGIIEFNAKADGRPVVCYISFQALRYFGLLSDFDAERVFKEYRAKIEAVAGAKIRQRKFEENSEIRIVLEDLTGQERDLLG